MTRKCNPMSEETKKKISESMKKIHQNMSPEEKIKVSITSSENNKKYWSKLSDKQKEEKLLKSINSKKSNKKKSEAMKLYYENMSEDQKLERLKEWIDSGHIACKENWDNLTVEQRKERLLKFLKRRDTKIEKIVERQLINLGVKYRKQYYRKSSNRKRGFFFDFYIPKLKLVIECNGTYWHNIPEMIERDKLKEEFVKASGRNILWLWEDEILNKEFDIQKYIS